MTAVVTLETARPGDVVISPDGKRIYSAGTDGYLRTYSAQTGELLSAAKIGTQLGGIDIAPDGSFLMVVDRDAFDRSGNSFNTRVYRVDTATGQTTAYTMVGNGLDFTFFDVAILSSGKVLLTQSFNGSGWVSMKLLDPATGQFALGPQVRQNSVLTPSADHSKVFIAEANISSGAIDIYQAGSGIVAQGGFGGFNFGIDAFRPSGTLAATYSYGDGILIFDSALKLVKDLGSAHPEWNSGQITDLTFDSTGRYLFVLDNQANTIVQLSTVDWGTVQTIALGVDVGGWSGGAFGNRLLLDPSGRFFTVITDTGLVAVANPAAPALAATPGDDNLQGLLFADTINGGNGADYLAGFGGDDTLNGEDGNDLLEGGPGNDTLNGGEGQDQILGGSGADHLAGGGGDDNLRGGAGVDSFDGESDDGAENIDTGFGDKLSFFERTATQGAVADLR
ncbi:MAG: hypothetical protein JOZ90_10455, partial [Alphaproteobacteria bacterium]|nr:hypothetical protein [Alphaproteobacteria bacterium]MBV9373245.1 hypothetical protein [Alphaproteobacteria bacterium]MBV9901505.1 hypothetical protein [Alphaproteobacteria bacterium]